MNRIKSLAFMTALASTSVISCSQNANAALTVSLKDHFNSFHDSHITLHVAQLDRRDLDRRERERLERERLERERHERDHAQERDHVHHDHEREHRR